MIRKHKHLIRRISTQGAMIVELAVVLPVILVVFYGMIEISRVLMLQHTADTAAYEGARAALVPGATAEEAIAAAQLMLDIEGLKKTTVTVIPEKIEESTALITVKVNVPVATNSWISFFRVEGYDVSSEVTLFCERPPVVRLTGIPKLREAKEKLKNERGSDSTNASAAAAKAAKAATKAAAKGINGALP